MSANQRQTRVLRSHTHVVEVTTGHQHHLKEPEFICVFNLETFALES